MQTIGQFERPERYSRYTVKSRILLEIQRRLQTQDWTFKTVAWDKIILQPLRSEYHNLTGPILAIVDNAERFSVDANKTQAQCEVFFEMAIPYGQEEEPGILLNLVQGELIEVLAGDHQLKEGGDGESLSCRFMPTGFEPEYFEGDPYARGSLTFDLLYRYRTHKPFNMA